VRAREAIESIRPLADQKSEIRDRLLTLILSSTEEEEASGEVLSFARRAESLGYRWWGFFLALSLLDEWPCDGATVVP